MYFTKVDGTAATVSIVLTGFHMPYSKRRITQILVNQYAESCVQVGNIFNPVTVPSPGDPVPATIKSNMVTLDTAVKDSTAKQEIGYQKDDN